MQGKKYLLNKNKKFLYIQNLAADQPEVYEIVTLTQVGGLLPRSRFKGLRSQALYNKGPWFCKKTAHFRSLWSHALFKKGQKSSVNSSWKRTKNVTKA